MKKLVLFSVLSFLNFAQAHASCEESARSAITLMNGDGGVTYTLASDPIWLSKGSGDDYKQVVGFVANYTVAIDGKLSKSGTEFISAECEIYSDPSSDSEMTDKNGDGILNLSDMKRTQLKL